MIKSIIQWRLMLSQVVLIKAMKLLNTLLSKDDCLQ
jgi:hypothetical protein